MGGGWNLVAGQKKITDGAPGGSSFPALCMTPWMWAVKPHQGGLAQAVSDCALPRGRNGSAPSVVNWPLARSRLSVISVRSLQTRW